MTPDEARNVITENNIKYIYVGPEERGWGNGLAAYNLRLNVFYQNSTITIYEVPADF